MSNRVLIDYDPRFSQAKRTAGLKADGTPVPLPDAARVESFLQEALSFIGVGDWELSVLFCADDYIARLNEEYRNASGATDVLSFEQGGVYTDENGDTRRIAGDIVISLDTLAKNAETFSAPINEELKRLLIHGALHLNGMDHADNSPEQPMLRYQEEIMRKFESVILL